MAYQIRYQLFVNWIGDGSGPVSVASAQGIMLGNLGINGLTPLSGAPGQPAGVQQVPGGDAPVIANFATALTGSASAPTGGMALDLYNAINTNLTQIQGFATGGG